MLELLHVKPIEGFLTARYKRGKPEYYHNFSGQNGTTKSYIKKNELDLAKNLAQQSYNKKVSKLVNLRIKQLQEIDKSFKSDEIESIFASLPDYRKAIVTPALVSY